MLGLGDVGVSLAFILTLVSTALCAVYGFINWNKPGAQEEAAEIAEEAVWEREDGSGGGQ